ncbi:MAG: MlaD family protein [Alphaproteobacteria bacterium]
MEMRANYLLVGTFTIVLFFGALGSVLWLTKVGTEQNMARYDVHFEGGVNGLRAGSAVTYRGIIVGQVRSVRIDPTNLERILVAIEVAADTPIKTDTVATLRVHPLTGNAEVTLTGGTTEAPYLGRKSGEGPPVIASRPSNIERLLAEAPAFVERIDMVVSRFDHLLSEENIETFTTTLANLERMSDTAVRVSQRIEDETMGFGSETIEAMRAVNRAAKKAEGTLNTMDRVGQQVEAMVAENREPVRDISTTLAYDMAMVFADLRELVVSMNRLTTELSRDPARFLFRGQQQGYETR